MPDKFNTRLRQILLLALIIGMGALLISTLYVFLPGLLGGVTLYILTRKYYFSLTVARKWSKWLTALLFIIVLIVGIAVPLYLAVMVISPKVSWLIDNQKVAADFLEMVRATALGIPLVSLAHGIVAGIGYMVLGINGWLLLAFLTAIFAYLPIIGIMVVWVPMVIYLYSTGQVFQATGLLIYSIVITGNVDYITRLGLLKKLGDIHPIITVFGVIVGLKLFGFMGLIFGPLLISYFVLLIKIYAKEFQSNPHT